jgi:LmbE family N-acetylglucosaminyl deacetylase
MAEKHALVISPHPDDLEIGMGGTTSKLVDSGVKVISLVVTDGRRSTSVYGLSEEELAELRESEVRESVGILGIDYLILLRLRDMKEEKNLSEFKKELSETIDRFNPEEIYLPHPEIDKHPTHRAVSSIALEEVSEMKAGPIQLWGYEVWTPFPQYERIEDISLQMHIKCAAIEAHRSQVEYRNYTEGIMGLNRYRAVFNETAGLSVMEYAEVFTEITP